VPCVPVVAAEFRGLAGIVAESQGAPHLRLLLISKVYPPEYKSKEEIHNLLQQNLVEDAIIKMLTRDSQESERAPQDGRLMGDSKR